MLSKPPSCEGCPLQSRGIGYSNPSGPSDSNILIIGEALDNEKLSGGFFDQQLRAVGIAKEATRFTTCLRCSPPDNWISNTSYERAALEHCRPALLSELAGGYTTIISLGAVATRETLRMHGVDYKGSLDHWRGYRIKVSGFDGMRRIVVPTIHPKFLIQGNQRYTGVQRYDLLNAKRASDTHVHTPFIPEPDCDTVVDPSVEWFEYWVDSLTGDEWLAVDIETPRKKGNEHFQPSDDPTYKIDRINFAITPKQGITVPWTKAYIPGIKRALATKCVKVYWNHHYDVPRLEFNEMTIGGVMMDAQTAWHLLQSDMGADEEGSGSAMKGNSLGFVTPVFLDVQPWKHLSDIDKGEYAARDAAHTLGVMMNLARSLIQTGQWDVFLDDFVKVRNRILALAEKAGLLVDQEALATYTEVLEKRIEELKLKITSAVPEEVRPLLPKVGLKERPRTEKFANFWREMKPKAKKLYDFAEEDYKPEYILCEDGKWRYRGEFNPASADQVRAYLDFKGLKTRKGKKAKTDKMTTSALELERLAKKYPKFIFRDTLDLREVEKTKGTYAYGIKKRLGPDGRIHTSFLERPSTFRLSSIDPNIQNITSGDPEEDFEAEPWSSSYFRKCIVATPGMLLAEVDFSAIEAVLTGWFARDPFYIRIAKAGVHSYLCAVMEHDAPPPEEIKVYSESQLVELKKHLNTFKHHPKRKPIKTVVHGVSYGRTPHGMHQNNPDLFPTLGSAVEMYNFFFDVCPAIKRFQNEVRTIAQKKAYLGLDSHPFRYRHWFYDVMRYDSSKGTYVESGDWNRVAAFFGQSGGGGCIRKAVIRLDEAGFSEWIRALIHDSVLFEFFVKDINRLLPEAMRIMAAPIKQLPCPPEWNLGEYLSIDVDAKVGENWLEMKDWKGEWVQ